MPENYAVRLSLSEAMLMRVTLEEKLATLKNIIEKETIYDGGARASLIEQYEALEKLANKL